jgi:glycosyltransferase involved in cell wall biosynthesis
MSATSPVRVLVDGRELTGMGRYRGIGTFTRNLLSALAEIESLQVRVLTADTGAAPDGVEPVRMWRRFDERRRSIYEHEALISLDVALRASDVVYSPYLTGIPYTRRPYVQTLHDVMALALPDPEFAYHRRWWSRWGRAYRRADVVVADSRYSAAEGTRLLGLDPARVRVAHAGVGRQFSPRDSAAPDDPPYLLAVSEYSPRKRFPDAFRVVGALADEGYPHRLEVGGRVEPQFADEVAALVLQAPHPERLHIRGFVDDLPALYRGASVFLCCSSYEGFGLPVLEAMASGVPVVSYANSSLVEVVGSAGVLVPDGDVGAMVEAVRSLLDDRDRWMDRRAAGLRHVAQFTWKRCARIYAEVFTTLAERAR